MPACSAKLYQKCSTNSVEKAPTRLRLNSASNADKTFPKGQSQPLQALHPWVHRLIHTGYKCFVSKRLRYKPGPAQCQHLPLYDDRLRACHRRSER